MCDISQDLGPFQIDYRRFYTCDMKGFEIVSTPLLIIWVFFLISILGNTASTYFSPTLGMIRFQRSCLIITFYLLIILYRNYLRKTSSPVRHSWCDISRYG